MASNPPKGILKNSTYGVNPMMIESGYPQQNVRPSVYDIPNPYAQMQPNQMQMQQQQISQMQMQQQQIQNLNPNPYSLPNTQNNSRYSNNQMNQGNQFFVPSMVTDSRGPSLPFQTYQSQQQQQQGFNQQPILSNLNQSMASASTFPQQQQQMQMQSQMQPQNPNDPRRTNLSAKQLNQQQQAMNQMNSQQLINQLGTSMANHYRQTLPASPPNNTNTMSGQQLMNQVGTSMANQ